MSRTLSLTHLVLLVLRIVRHVFAHLECHAADATVLLRILKSHHLRQLKARDHPILLIRDFVEEFLVPARPREPLGRDCIQMVRGGDSRTPASVR